MDRPDFELERASEPVTSPPAAGGELEVFDGAVDFNAVADEAAPPDGIQLEEQPVVEAEPNVVIEGLARTQYEGSGMFDVPEETAETAPSERATSPASDLPLIMPEDLEPEPELPPAPVPEPAVRYEQEPEPEPEPEPQPEPQPEPEPEPAVVGAASPPPIPHLPDDDGAADTETLSRAEPVLTETMAELYLRQGHREDARRVYEALSAQRPDDVRLRRKVAALSGMPVAKGSGQSAGAFLKGILQARPGAPTPQLPPASPVFARGEAMGQDGDSQAGTTAPGNPTRPASDAISLDSVFGEESARGAAAATTEPVSDKPARLPAASGGFSFDDFFGSSGVPGSGANDSGARPPRHSGRNRAAEQEEDLDQFQAWLKSLKA
jgi:hypothetical protein